MPRLLLANRDCKSSLRTKLSECMRRYCDSEEESKPWEICMKKLEQFTCWSLQSIQKLGDESKPLKMIHVDCQVEVDTPGLL